MTKLRSRRVEGMGLCQFSLNGVMWVFHNLSFLMKRCLLFWFASQWPGSTWWLTEEEGGSPSGFWLVGSALGCHSNRRPCQEVAGVPADSS